MRNPEKQSEETIFARTAALLKLLIMCLVLIAFLAAILIFSKYYPQIKVLYLDAQDKVDKVTIESFSEQETSYIYDASGERINKLYDTKDIIYVPSSGIPEKLKQAFVAVEDKNFYSHNGVDIKANVAAVVEYIKNKGDIKRGASTITQQLARGVFLTMDVRLERKIEEIFISYFLEKKYTKDQIMEFYINTIYFSNDAYGIGSASMKYFSKQPKDLTLSQLCFLAAIPNSPTYYDPFKNMDNTITRRNLILSRMRDQDYIDEKTYQDALKEKIELKPTQYKKQNFVDTYVLDETAKILMKLDGFQFQNSFKTPEKEDEYKKNYSDVYSQKLKEIYRGGYRIYTTIDMNKQRLLQKSVDDVLSKFTDEDNGVFELQGAAVSIDNESGNVVAIVGGRTQDNSGYTLNRAFQSFRQPGSTIKPIAVYGPAFEKGMYPGTIIDDKKFDGGPKNDNDSYAGPIPIRSAVENSKNTVAWQVFDKITPVYGLSFLKNMNFSKITDKDNNLASSLGGLTYGASPLEMAGAYSTLARGGIFIAPTGIKEIKDSKGNVLYSSKPEYKNIYSKDTIYLLTDVLKGVIQRGTGYGLKFSKMPVAGKTGTTSSQKDGWFCGYSPYYTTAVWVGYDTPKRLNGLYGRTYPGSIWKQYMSVIHENLPVKDFEKPSEITKVYVSKTSGKLVPDTYQDGIYELASRRFMPDEDLDVKAAEEARIKAEEEAKAKEEEDAQKAAEAAQNNAGAPAPNGGSGAAAPQPKENTENQKSN